MCVPNPFIKVILHAALQATIISLHENSFDDKFHYWKIVFAEISENKKLISRLRIQHL